MNRRRASDHFTLPAVGSALLGLVIIGAGLLLKKMDPGIGETPVDILFVVGGLTIPGNHLVSALKAWRKQ